MAFPTTPANGDTHTVGSITWSYNSTTDIWTQANTSGSGGGVPTGTVVSLATSTEPTGYLECNGAAVSRTTYSNLFVIISDNYGAGDGTTTFNLPDLRGEFIRGFDNSRGVDSGRNFGSAQSDENKQHGHAYVLNRDNNGGVGTDGGFITRNIASHNSVIGPATGSASAASGSAIGTSGGSEARPRNVALMYCIKT